MNIHNKKRIAGFSIVEMMVAIALGLLLIGITASIWVTNKKSYTLQEDLGRIQENARFALHFLEYDIRMAGYLGCDSKPDYSTIVPIESDSSSITIRYFSSLDFDVSSITRNATNAVITLNEPTKQDIKEGDALGLSNCFGSEIVTVAEDGITKDGDDKIVSIKTKEALSNDRPPMEFNKLHLSQGHKYEVSGGYLVRDGFSLVGGIEAWEFLFGEDTNGSGISNLEPDEYRTEANVSDWQKIRSVRIALLVSSIDEYGLDKDTRTYSLLTTNYDPSDDRRRRRVFRTTIKTRNLQ